MIPVPSGVRVWLATGVTDMRRGVNTLALQVQQDLGRDPHAGDLYVFRGRRGDLIKILWHDGLGISLYAKRLEHGSFGRRRPTERCRSLRRSSATCWKGSTGATRFGPGARRGPVELRLTMADVGEPGQELPGGGACDSLLIMAAADSHDTEGLKAALVASEARAAAAEAQIAALTLMIEKLRRALYGRRSERKERLLDQLELALDELTASATEDELAAGKAAARTTEVSGFVRRKPSRKPFPEHLPRERVVVPAPTSCACCGSDRLSKVGEDVTETLEVIPRRWKVIRTVREKFTCRDCERISQPPAPFHATPRGWAGPNLLATILFEKYGQHLPLNRQRDRYAREGVDLSLSTLADQVGACAVALKPLHDLIAAHVLAAERLHGDDTPVPVLAKGKTDTARAWVYVRDDAPFGGPDPPLCSATRGIVRAITRLSICGPSPGSCRPTPMLATGGSTSTADRRDPSPRRSAGAMDGASSTSSPISRRTRGTASARRRSHRWRWRP